MEWNRAGCKALQIEPPVNAMKAGSTGKGEGDAIAIASVRVDHRAFELNFQEPRSKHDRSTIDPRSIHDRSAINHPTPENAINLYMKRDQFVLKTG